jgi:hypothetical protein
VSPKVLTSSYVRNWLVGFLALSLWFALPLFAEEKDTPSTLLFDLRYQYSSTQRDLLAATTLYAASPFSWLEAELGGRLFSSVKDFEGISYKGEVRVPFLSILAISVRLSHTVLLPETTSTTNLLFQFEAHGRPFSFLSLFAHAGWYERFTLLSKTLILPTLPRNSTRDEDFAVLAGAELQSTKRLAIGFQVGTVEEIDVFNLNDPFFRLALQYHPEDWDWTLVTYARYRVLLGFGRLDELTFGVSLVKVL